MLSRRNFLTGISAAAIASVTKAAIPVTELPLGALIDEQPDWMPEGYILPKGQPLSKLMYRELFNTIEANFGETPTTFNLPDLSAYNGGQVKTILAIRNVGHTPAGSIVNYFVPVAG